MIIVIPILLIIVTILFTYLTAYIDASHIKKGEFIHNHGSRWGQRFCFFLAISILNPIYGTASAFLFTALFDQVLNEYRSLPLMYLGSVSAWDKFFIKRIWLYIIIKVSLLLISLLLFLCVGHHFGHVL